MKKNTIEDSVSSVYGGEIYAIDILRLNAEIKVTKNSLKLDFNSS